MNPVKPQIVLMTIMFLLSMIVIFILLNLKIGSIPTSLSEVLPLLINDDDSNKAFSLFEIRLPRALNALFVGVGLALSGSIIQVIIRNPLGDPGLTGVSSGAALGVALVIVFITHAGWAVVLGGITGGSVAAAITFILARSSGFQDISVILAGLAVSIFFLAATSMLMILNSASMQTLYYWMIGGFANKGWEEFSYLWPGIILGGCLSLMMSPVLEILRMEDKVAGGLGVNVVLWRLLGAVLSVILASVSVAVAGPIGFVGFVAPHLVRVSLAQFKLQASIVQLLPLVALTGGLITLIAECIVRALPLGNRVPAGVLIAVFGGVVFLVLARRLKG